MLFIKKQYYSDRNEKEMLCGQNRVVYLKSYAKHHSLKKICWGVKSFPLKKHPIFSKIYIRV